MKILLWMNIFLKIHFISFLSNSQLLNKNENPTWVFCSIFYLLADSCCIGIFFIFVIKKILVKDPLASFTEIRLFIHQDKIQ